MGHLTPAVFANWQNFYVIAGSSAGALTGLQFVVMTLVAQARAVGSEREIHAFGTPTVIHFCTALLISAILTAPWQSVTMLGACLGASGLAGVGYLLRVLWHIRKADYDPGLADWIWYLGLPLVAHLALIGSAVLVYSEIAWSPALLAADVLFFLLLGVHNSWDTVTFVAVRHGRKAGSSDGESQIGGDRTA